MAQRNQLGALSAALVAIFTVGILPGTAFAQSNDQKNKNNWRNLAIAAGGLGALGFLKHDPTIGFVGTAGALYSLNRYEHDRKSQSQSSRARASIFSQPYIYRNGQRYDRKLVNRNGKKYYRFVRHG